MNLETLFIEIDGNASKATSSIDGLISKLGDLSNAATNAATPLKNLALALQSVQQVASGKGINWKNVMPTASQSSLQNMKQTATQMQKSATAMNKYASAMQNVTATTNSGQSASATIGQAAQNAGGVTNPYASQMVQNTAQTKSAAAGQQSLAQATNTATSAINQQAQALLNCNSKIKLMQQNLAAMKSAYMAQANSGKMSNQQMIAGALKIQNYQNQINRAIAQQNQMQTSQVRLTSSTKHLGSQIMRIAKNMLIRSAIRSLVSSAREGLENYYHYSKAVGSGFADSMDQMASTAAQMKNQLGAALATALSALLPVLNALADAALTALNAITALFAALGGKDTYSRATKQTAEFAKETKKAGGAAKELLAAFDELNVIANSGGGGGGGSAPDYGSMFEEVPVPEWAKIGADLLPWLLGALGLKKLFDLITKLHDLIKGKTVKYTIKVNQPTQPDWSQFEEQLNRIKATLGELPALVTAIKTEMTLLSTTIWGAVGAAGALAIALMACSSPKLTVKLNKDDYDDWKKDLDKLRDNLAKNPLIVKINIDFDDSVFKSKLHEIQYMCTQPYTIKITTKVDMNSFNNAKYSISSWCNKTDSKPIQVTVSMGNYDYAKKAIDDWVAKTDIKNIKIEVDDTQLNVAIAALDAWLADTATKNVYVVMDPKSWHEWTVYADGVTSWANIPVTKRVLVAFDPVSIAGFKAASSVLEAWAAETLTKYINVVIKYTTDNSAVNSGTSIASGILNNINNSASTTAQNKTSPAPNKSPIIRRNEKGTPSMYWDDTKDTVIVSNPDPKGTSGTFNPQNMTDLLMQYNGGGILFNGANWLKADGAYGIPKGDLFIANEQSAELVGSINGKTSVANQEQIIEGISRGVSEANNEQNMLLRQQNEYLRGILEKEFNVKIGASASFGRVARQSLDMYTNVAGG